MSKIIDLDGLTEYDTKLKEYLSDNFIESSNQSIKNIIELTYAQYKTLEDNDEIDPNTEYHIVDAGSNVDQLQQTLISLQNQITALQALVLAPVDYSTDEVELGILWIDNRPIYRKVIDLGNLPNNSQKTVAHNISNLGTTVWLRAMTSGGGSGNFFPIPESRTPLYADYQVGLWCNSTNIVVETGTDRTSASALAIIDYTKSTDTPIIRHPQFTLSITNYSTHEVTTKTYSMSSASMTIADWLASADNIDGLFIKEAYGPGYYVALPTSIAPDGSDRYYITMSNELTEEEVLADILQHGQTYAVSYDSEPGSGGNTPEPIIPK